MQTFFYKSEKSLENASSLFFTFFLFNISWATFHESVPIAFSDCTAPFQVHFVTNAPAIAESPATIAQRGKDYPNFPIQPIFLHCQFLWNLNWQRIQLNCDTNLLWKIVLQDFVWSTHNFHVHNYSRSSAKEFYYVIMKNNLCQKYWVLIKLQLGLVEPWTGSFCYDRSQYFLFIQFWLECHKMNRFRSS